MKKLPSIYKHNISKTVNNNKRVCHIKEEEKTSTTLEELFNNKQFYDIKLKIKTKDKLLNTYIIAYNKKEIVTLNNETINIEDIEEISLN